jgi:hypothetical protein
MDIVHRNDNGKLTTTVTQPLTMYTTAYGVLDVIVRRQLEEVEDYDCSSVLLHPRQRGWIGTKIPASSYFVLTRRNTILIPRPSVCGRAL